MNVGIRIDLPEPVELEGPQFSPAEGVLRGGDILIASIKAERFMACRSEDRFCRTADGLELLAFAALMSTFLYPEAPYFEQPHVVEDAETTVIAGEEAHCFTVRARATAPAEEDAPGVPPDGEALPQTLCYARDGIPLRQQRGSVTTVEASVLERHVDSSVFDLPYPFVPSVYDDQAD